MFKRILAALLAAMTLFSVAACGTGDNGEDTAPESQVQGTEAETEDELFPDIEKQDYKGATFQMIGWTAPGNWYYAESYNNSEKGNTVLNNTIYEMNTLVEEHLNVEMAYETVKVVNGHEIFNTVNPTLMSGDDTYQLCTLHAYYDYTNFITKNGALDLRELTAMDLDKPYWNREVMEMLSINDKMYIGLGDLCQYSLYMIYCNKDMLGDASVKVPYDQVRNGEWTLDLFTSMTMGRYVDNGDGVRNEKDIYGFAGCWDGEGNAFMQACDIYVAKKNENDIFELTLYGERLVDMYDKLYAWSKDESVLPWNFHSPAFTVPFKNSQSYFTCGPLGTQFLDAEFEVGILPLPKYDVAQESYNHVNWGNNIIVPSTVQNKEMVGQVLELMGYYSNTLVLEKYYDEVLQLRVSEAPDDRDMVELIYDTVVYDPGIAFCDGNGQLYNLVYTTCFGIREDNANITSYYQKNYRHAEKYLKNLFKERPQR